MTAQILSVDLNTITQETKRKHPDIRSAAEQSLQDLKSLPSTSEAQLAADLRRRPHFINPFLAACKLRQPKAVVPAVSCLQRLIISTGLPKERLKDVLEAFQECVGNGLDVQLKILQALPSLLQGYGDVLEGELQFIVLQLCTTLQQVKNTAVSSTASATLQQTVSSLYEKVEAEDEHAEDIAPIEGVTVQSESVPVRPAAYDAYRILNDICLIIEGQQPHHLMKATISSTFGLELIEALLLNHAEVFEDHAEQSDLLLNRVMPLVNSCLAERHGFAVTVRAMRLLCILMREHLGSIHTECEVAFGLLNHVIETETQQPWRRVLCMETFRLLYSNPDLFVDVYSQFDAKENRRNIVQDNLALFVRLASEKPALIGLGQQSTVPATQSSANSQDQAMLEAENAAGMIGGDFGVSEKDVPGISNEWSVMKVPCLDQLDKAEGPTVPETYIYSLVLTCVNQLSDVLAKIVLPIAMHQNKTRKAKSPPRGDQVANESAKEEHGDKPARQSSTRSARSKSIPTNPLELTENPAHASIKVAASLISGCWPAVLATSSTFFNAALDADFYRSLVRSFQKFTQVAGILRLATPRDALLTSLSKVAVPPSLLSSNESSVTSPTSSVASPSGSLRFRNFSPMVEAFAPSTGSETLTRSRRSSLDAAGPTLSQRNLMCLRALVHLAIALGAILDSAWSIILDSIQKAHVLLSASRNLATAQDYRTAQSHGESAAAPATLSSEISAVENAMSRLFQSTSDYPTQAFKTVLAALCKLVHEDTVAETKTRPPNDSPNLMTPPKLQRRVPSVSGLVTSAVVQPEYSYFAIAKLGEVAKANLNRLTQDPDNGWTLLVKTLKEATSAHDADDKTRKMAADVVARFAVEACITTIDAAEKDRVDIQQRSFGALMEQVNGLPQSDERSAGGVDLEIHQTLLEALHSILEHCADAILTGWTLIFSIIGSVFKSTPGDDSSKKPLSAKLARSSFASLQMICSDLIDSVPPSSFPTLVDLVAEFGLQTLDINISLTVITLFWNVSDHLREQVTHFDFRSMDGADGSSDSPKRKQSLSMIWLGLQQRLAQMANDHRSDVRNGSIHIIYRTLANCLEQLHGPAVTEYIEKVVFEVIRADTQRQREVGADETMQDTLKAYHNTSKIVLEGVARFFSEHLSVLEEHDTTHLIWHIFLSLCAAYLDCRSFFLSSQVYEALTKIIEAEIGGRSLSSNAITRLATLWAQAVPNSSYQYQDDTNYQESAYVAYLRCIERIYERLDGELGSDQVDLMLQRLHECVLKCPAPPYSNDVDRPTALQDGILSCCNRLCQGSNESWPGILKHIAQLTRLPYEASDATPGSSKLTFVAFAKKAMDLIERTITSHTGKRYVVSEDAITAILSALQDSMRRQYSWRVQGRDPAMWRKATTTFLSVLSKSLDNIDGAVGPGKASRPLMRALTLVVATVQGTDYDEEPHEDVLISDETFDLDSIATFRALITPVLDQSQGLDDNRFDYVGSLFSDSVLHRADLVDEDEPFSKQIQASPVQLLKVNTGRTCEPPFNPRARMCYSCLDELFALATSVNLLRQDSAGTRTTAVRQSARLAPFAFKALLVRCAMPLKRYVADQPLRGRMPTPMSQRLELMHVLQRVTALYTQDKDGLLAFDQLVPEWPGLLSGLAPLVNQARQLTDNDRELANAMGKLLDLVLRRRMAEYTD